MNNVQVYILQLVFAFAIIISSCKLGSTTEIVSIGVSELSYTQISDWYHKVSFILKEEVFHLESEDLDIY